MIKPWLKAIRDYFIPYMPRAVAQWLLGHYDFAFVAHPLVLEDLARQYPNLNLKNKNFLKFISKHLWPVTGADITGFKDRNGQEIRGIVLFCPMSTRLLVLRRKPAIKKIIRILRIAEKLNVKMVGLGAYIPIVTRDGKIIAKKTNLSMTTGTSFSAIIAMTNALRLASMCKRDFNSITVAIVGAGGSVGSICSRLALDNFNTAILIDKNKEALDALMNGTYLRNLSNKTIYLSNSVESVKNADLIIVTTNTPGIIIRSEHLKPGALVVDAAQPRNVSTKIPFTRKDVIVTESGVAEIKGLSTNFKFDLKSDSEVFSCLAEVLILLWSGVKGKQVGVFDMQYVYDLQSAANKIGIDIPKFRNRTGFVLDQDIAQVAMIKNIAAESQNENGSNGTNRILQLSL